MRKQKNRMIILLLGLMINLQTYAAPIVFTDENLFISAMQGYMQISEGFDSSAWSDSVYDGAGSPGSTSVISNNIAWSSNDTMYTSSGWGISGNGIWDYIGRPDALYGTASGMTLYGIGGWYTRTNAIEVNLSVDDGPILATFDLTNTYQTSNNHIFYGVIDPNGFTSFSLEAARIGDNWGADNFTFFAQPSAVPIPGAFWLFFSGVAALSMARRKIIPNK